MKHSINPCLIYDRTKHMYNGIKIYYPTILSKSEKQWHTHELHISIHNMHFWWYLFTLEGDMFLPLCLPKSTFESSPSCKPYSFWNYIIIGFHLSESTRFIWPASRSLSWTCVCKTLASIALKKPLKLKWPIFHQFMNPNHFSFHLHQHTLLGAGQVHRRPGIAFEP